MLIGVGEENETQELMGKLRVHISSLMAQRGLLEIDRETEKWLWVEDFPLLVRGLIRV